MTSEAPALSGPLLEPAPPRAPRSVRRTAHLDVTWVPDAHTVARVLAIGGAARDLVTLDTTATVVEDATLRVTIDELGRVASVEQTPPTPSCAEMVGAASGFRIRAETKQLLALTNGSLLGLLIDDLSGVAAPTGYAAMREGLTLVQRVAPVAVEQVDVCAGWRRDGYAARLREAGRELTFEDPFVEPPWSTDDPWAWHEMGELDPRKTRRLRRLDLIDEGDHLRIDAMFRDVSVDHDLTVRVVHEYSLAAVVDPVDLRITSISADPRALPFVVECPGAAASAGFLVGETVHDLRRTVRKLSTGTASCTHLNDMLRSLADVATMVHLLPKQ